MRLLMAIRAAVVIILFLRWVRQSCNCRGLLVPTVLYTCRKQDSLCGANLLCLLALMQIGRKRVRLLWAFVIILILSPLVPCIP